MATLNDYNSQVAASVAACSADPQRTPPICEVAKKNTGVILDLECGLDTLLELLKGGRPNGDSKNRESNCLADEVMMQAAMLNDLHGKLAEALNALSGDCGG